MNLSTKDLNVSSGLMFGGQEDTERKRAQKRVRIRRCIAAVQVRSLVHIYIAIQVGRLEVVLLYVNLVRQ